MSKEEILKLLDNLEYPSCFTSHGKCAKCCSFGTECTNLINEIDALRHRINELTDLR